MTTSATTSSASSSSRAIPCSPATRRSRSRFACSAACRPPRSPARFSSPSRRSRSASCARSGRSPRSRSPSRCRAARELGRALAAVLEVVYLVFNEGYSATAGEDWMRPALCEDALRLGRVLAELVPAEPDVHALVALMEIQASRIAARVGPNGEPVLLLDQDRTRVGPGRIARGLAALVRAEETAGAGRLDAVSRPGADRRMPRARAQRWRHRLESDRRPLRGAPADRAEPSRRAEPRGGALDGVRPGGRPRAGRCNRERARARRISPATERPRRPPRQARAIRRGPSGARARREAHAERARARAAPRSREGLRPQQLSARALSGARASRRGP